MRSAWSWSGIAVFLSACLAAAQEGSLTDARRGFKTKLTREEREAERMPAPPPRVFSIVDYTTALGPMQAYLSKPLDPKKKHPAIVWITGGFPAGGAGESAWKGGPVENDQSARAYRLAGLVMMFPALRGGQGNPGHQESFLGEVEDVIAAAEYLRKVEYVDPARIYLGGHSTGGTLALLVAESTDLFKAVLSFGPVEDPTGYGQEVLTFDAKDEREARLRAPIHWTPGIRTPTWVIEGTKRGNLESLRALEKANKNPKLRCAAIKGASHFDLLAPLNGLIAEKLAKLTADQQLALTAEELQGAFDRQRAATREADDLEAIASARRRGLDIRAPQPITAYFYSSKKDRLAGPAKKLAALGFEAGPITRETNDEGEAFFVLTGKKKAALSDLAAFFETTAALARLAEEGEVDYGGWEAGE